MSFPAEPRNLYKSQRCLRFLEVTRTRNFAGTKSRLAENWNVWIFARQCLTLSADRPLATVVSSKRFKKAIANGGHSQWQHSGTPTGHVPLQERHQRHTAIWFNCRKSRNGEPSLGAAQQTRGKPYTMRYDAVNAILLNEFLKANRKMRGSESTVAKQQPSAGKARSDDCRAAKAN